ncbi:MAG: hemolysin III family protein [Cyclobacteriaceae bacterium]|nr:hemolysin III family protein [Cyclobacteriaceae bacterium]UYN85653.1 MAG: hemolysin III family protein [Cyclobacteriaceae bacterium]
MKEEYVDQSVGEEIANSISHGLGAFGGIVVTPFLIIHAIPFGAAAIVGASVFGAAIIIMYLSSTLYHAFPVSRTKKLFRIFDHSAIYVLIAGTYTPFALGILHGFWGWVMLAVMWTLAAAGIVFKSITGTRKNILSTILYVAMGWMGMLMIKPLMANMECEGLYWLLAGGISYTVGVIFYLMKKIPYTHFIWHLFVLGGTACHVVTVMRFAN